MVRYGALLGHGGSDNRTHQADFRTLILEEVNEMEIIQRILEAYSEYVKFILGHIFWFIPK